MSSWILFCPNLWPLIHLKNLDIHHLGRSLLRGRATSKDCGHMMFDFVSDHLWSSWLSCIWSLLLSTSLWTHFCVGTTFPTAILMAHVEDMLWMMEGPWKQRYLISSTLSCCCCCCCTWTSKKEEKNAEKSGQRIVREIHKYQTLYWVSSHKGCDERWQMRLKSPFDVLQDS